MPKFVRVEDASCQSVYINPDYIVTIRANPEEETALIIMAAGDPIHVPQQFYDAVLQVTE